MSDSRTPEQEAPTPATCPVCGSAGDAIYTIETPRSDGRCGARQLIENRRFCHECLSRYPAARSSPGETPHG
jgi:hypothetical protein